MPDMQLEDASMMPNEPGIGSQNGQKLRHVTYKLDDGSACLYKCCH